MVSRVTLPPMGLALPEPVVECPRILGVDEFALKRSRRYGTVLVDVEPHRVIGILADYPGDAFAAWLTARPGAHVICRDRAHSFSDGARRGAPQAQQCADRFHLWQNLGTAVERATGRLRSTWLPPERAPFATAEVLPGKDEGPLTQRNRQRHAAVHALMERGVGLTRIMRELRMDPKTVRRFMRAATVEEILAHGPSGRTGMLDAHADYLARRFDEGCTGARILHAELAAQGIHVSKRTVRRFVHRMREHGARPRPGRWRRRRERSAH